MSLLRKWILTVIPVLLLGGTACAEPHAGYYVGAYLGVPTGSVSATDDLGRFVPETDTGSYLAMTVGYDLLFAEIGNGRVEVELSQRSNGISSVKFSDGTFDATGDLVVQSVMLNSYSVYRELPWVTPYFGLGIGGAQVNVDGMTVAGQTLVDDGQLVLAYQAGCGIEVGLSPSWRLDLGYRYFATGRAELRESDGSQVRIDYASHTGMLGLVWMY